MNLEITNQNLYLLLPGKVAAVCALFAEDNHCSMKEAMKMFYRSTVYRQLEQEDTKFWHLGAVALLEEWYSSIAANLNH